MTEFFGSVWWLAVAVGILVTFHEFGHFWVARRCGVHVLRFSVGFGKPLLKRTGRDGTEFVVSAIPLGGYVKMLDEREFVVDPGDVHRAFNRKSVWQRIAITLAGPAANLLLCFVLLWSMFLIGLPDYLPIVGESSGLAKEAGFAPGDRLLSVDGERVDTWTDAGILLGSAALDHRAARVEVAHADGGHQTNTFDLARLGSKSDAPVSLGEYGIVPQQITFPAIVGSLDASRPKDGLQAGDRIVAIGGQPVATFRDIGIQTRAQARAGRPLHLDLERGTERIAIDVMPVSLRDTDPPRLGIGITSPAPKTAVHDGLRRYGPIEALGESARTMRQQTVATFGMLRRIFTRGETQGISGPVGIARYANEAAQSGLAWFLFFLASLSLSLGILNLLPVPILDGGHLLYYLMELVKGSPVSERAMMVGQSIGLVLLGGLMCVAFYNDLLHPLS